MRTPAKRTDDMTEPANRVERRIEGCAADGIEHDVEAAAAAVLGDIVFDRHVSIVDRDRAKPFDESLAGGRAGREYIGAEDAGDLDGDVTDPAGPAMDQDLLPRMRGSAIDQSFTSRDADQRNGLGLTPGNNCGD